MILARFDLTLYCDYCDRNWPLAGAAPTVITGADKRETLTRARKRGWRLDWKGDRAKCPSCVQAKRTELLNPEAVALLVK